MAQTDTYRPMTIGNGIRAAAVRAPEKAALVLGTEQRSYRSLVRRMSQIGNLARDHFGIQPGDRVALVAPNIIDYPELVAGLSDIGAIVATLNPRLAAAELAAIVEDCTPNLLIYHPSCAAAVAAADLGGIATLPINSEYHTLLARSSENIDLPAVDEADAFALAYTSGTTGRPKGVLLSHRSRAITFQSMAAEYGCFGVDDRFLALAPMCHGAGFVFACAGLFYGSTTELFDSADPEAILSRLNKQDITGIFMVPTHLARIFDLPQATLDGNRAHALRTMISNAAALPQPFKERAIEQFGAGLLHETYGSTEGGIVTNIRPADLLRKPGSVGHPFPLMEVQLRLADGTVAPTDETGELFSRGPTSFNGYWNRPSETAETVQHGWVTVGDIATRDAEGFITIVDRKKDMVVTGGMNVFPREVEAIIAGLPGVREVAVIGQPHHEWGESLHAFIVSQNGKPGDADAIIAGCRDRLAGYKVPRKISFIAELPRNAGGKILKTTLRESISP
ncbi:MAG: acyl--CoA ligase [Sphingomonadaceae bacterium]|nr:acyl--CoA ligase [Sphingomonadaceae bacterium]